MENLGRGVVAVRASTTSVLVSWRLLGLDPANLAFKVYRATNGGAAVPLTTTAVTGATNFSDNTVNAAVDNVYTVRPVLNGVEQAASAGFLLKANTVVEPVIRLPIAKHPGEGYTIKFVWVGDLDGDGEYDYVLDRLAPFTAGDNDVGLGNQYLEAYKSKGGTGTPLWRIDLGPSSRGTYNISPGAATLGMGMFDGVTVYDLDGDGKAEVILKVAQGVKFPDGTTFSDTNPEQQHIAILNGQTGNRLATRAFPDNFKSAGRMGTQLGIGYPDGITPSIYFWGRNRNADKSFNDIFASWSWKGGTTITENWRLPKPNNQGMQASHQMRIIDVDGDGRDEMATGNFVVNSDGTVRYVLPGVIHGDRFFIGKMNPNSTTMQGYGVQQDNPSGLLEYFYDATTGVIQWTHSSPPGSAPADIGRGLVGDIDPRFPGFEVWSFSGLYNGPSGALAEQNKSLSPYPSHSIWWDGDVLAEGLNDYKIEKWNPLAPTATNATPRQLTLSNYGAQIYGHNPQFYGDILGDWRTEVVTTNSAGDQLLIFTTNRPTTVRAYTMAHNPAYRNHMTIKGYMQSPVLDYYFGEGMSTPPVPNIRYAGRGTMQAESALLAGGAGIESERNGYQGTGYVDFPGYTGTATFTGVNGGAGGTKAVTIRYANGGTTARTGQVRINGATQTVSFPATGGWTNWSTVTVSLKLAAGTANTLVVQANGTAMANIDAVTIP
jgi:rhamnogalacturonan endolyase